MTYSDDQEGFKIRLLGKGLNYTKARKQIWKLYLVIKVFFCTEYFIIINFTDLWEVKTGEIVVQLNYYYKKRNIKCLHDHKYYYGKRLKYILWILFDI